MSSTTTTVTTSSSSSARGRSGRNQGSSSSRHQGQKDFPHIQHTRPKSSKPQGPSPVDLHHQPPKGRPHSQVSVDADKELTSVADRVISSQQTSSSYGQLCMVCCDPFEYCSLGSCNHHGVCSTCSLRMRALYKNHACSLCKTELTKVVFTKDFTGSFDEENLKNCTFDEDLGIYYSDKNIVEKCRHMLKTNCPLKDCGKSLNSINDLKRHISRDHPGLSLCNICLDHRKVFAHERRLFTREELAKHTKEGDADDPSFKGHQECLFCHKLFYGKDELYEHLELDHEHCFICRKRGSFNEYYINYASLEMHFRKDHYLCEDEACRAKAFVVFPSDIDLKAHQADVHMKDMRLSRSQQRQIRQIDLGFVYSSRQEENEHRRRSHHHRQSEPRDDQGPGTHQRVRKENSGEDLSQKGNQQAPTSSKAPAIPSTTTTTAPSAPVTPASAPSSSSSSPVPKSDSPAPKPSTPPGFENVVLPSAATAAAQAIKKPNVAPPPGFEKPPPERSGQARGGKGLKQEKPAQPRSDIKSRAPAGFGQLTQTESVETSSLRGGLPQPPVDEDSGDSGSGSDSDSPAEDAPIDPAIVKRNQDLMQKLRLIFKGDTDKLDQFRQISQLFRNGELTAPGYYNLFLQMLGPHANKVFQEMVDLLPEEDKKASLLAARADRKAVKKGGYTVPKETPEESKPNVVVISKAEGSKKPTDSNTVVCKQCKKIVQKSDFEWHTASHFASDFGSLPSSSAPRGNQPAPSVRPPPQFIDFPTLKNATAVKEDKSKPAARSSYTAALTGITPNTFAGTYAFDLASLPPLPSSSSSSSAISSASSAPSYSDLASGQASTSGSGKKKGKGKVLLHFG